MKQNKSKAPIHPLSKKHKDSDKLSPSTASPQSAASLSANPFKSCKELWSADGQQIIERLIPSMCAIQGSQEEMKARFDRIVQFLTGHIARNSLKSRKLAQKVTRLGEELQQTGEDIRAIEGMLYLGRKEKQMSRGSSREDSIERNQSRISNNSTSRKLFFSSRSDQRSQLAKKNSGRLFMCMNRQ